MLRSSEDPKGAMMTDDERMQESEASQAAPHPIPNGISSSMSGPGIGDDVALKRAHLLDPEARSEPQMGRREAPEPYDPRPMRIMYAKGLLAGAVVAVIVLVFLIVAGSMNPVA